MKHFEIPQIVALIAILCHQSTSLPREKRSFWPFFGGGGSTDAVETPATEVAEASPQYVDLPTHSLPEAAVQQLSPGYSYPIFRVHKYNGFELRPLVPSQHLQQLHTQVSYRPIQQGQQFQHFQPNQVQHLEPTGIRQPNGQNGQQTTANTNCQAKAPAQAIPPELQDLAQQFGIKDASKLPSLDDAMSLLGTTTRAETIQTIREIAATPDGMNLVRQFLASDEGAAASQEPTTDNQCDDASATQQIGSQQSSNANVPQMFVPNMIQHQQIGLPYHPPQHDVYGLPNAYRANSFQASQSQGIYQPPTHIMSLVKNEALSQEYGVPNELSTAHSEHQGYNVPKVNIGQAQQGHEIYGLPNMKPASPFRQAYYAPRSNQVESAQSEGVPHEQYNVPNEASSSSSATQEPHQSYGVPTTGESHASQQHETYGLPTVQEPVNFHQPGPYPPKTETEKPHQEYGVPSEESNAGEQHEVYGLPNAEEAVNFHQQGPYPPEIEPEKPHEEYGLPKTEESSAGEQHETYGLPNVQESSNSHQQGPYPPKEDNLESAEKSEQTIVPHKEYNVPNEDNPQTPHVVYGIPSDEQNKNAIELPQETYGPPQQTYGIPNNEHENVQQDQQVVHNEYVAPVLNTQAANTVDNVAPHTTYALPHQQFFETPNVFRQPQLPHNSRYGAPTKHAANNLLTHVPIIRQIDGTLDRAHTTLELGQLLTTTLRPEAGFLERVGAWTRYFAPPGPTIPIVPPQVTEDVKEPHGHTQNTFTNPISKLPGTPQLPNAYIPKKFLQPPPQSNQGPFVRVNRPTNTYELPHQQPQPFDGQTVEEFVPDISQLPLDQRFLGSDLRNSYGIPTGDSSASASETNERHVAVMLPNESSIKNEEIIDNDVVAEEPQTNHGPKRFSSYDSHATGKVYRANDEALIQLIPTQKPHNNEGRRLRQVEESSIIDAIATMTSGFRPITCSNGFCNDTN